MTFREICVAVLLVAGVAIDVISCLGLVAMRDALDRLHCAGAASFGSALIAVAVLVQESFSLIGNKALAIAVLVLVTNPVLAHATARTVRIRELGDWRPVEKERIEVERR